MAAERTGSRRSEVTNLSISNDGVLLNPLEYLLILQDRAVIPHLCLHHVYPVSVQRRKQSSFRWRAKENHETRAERLAALRGVSGSHLGHERLHVGEAAAEAEVHGGVVVKKSQAHLIISSQTPLFTESRRQNYTTQLFLLLLRCSLLLR